MRFRLALVAVCFLALPVGRAVPLDAFAAARNRTVADQQLERLLHSSVRWLRARAAHQQHQQQHQSQLQKQPQQQHGAPPALEQYAQHLARLLRPGCRHCVDYFEAVTLVRSLGQAVERLLAQDEALLPACAGLWPVVRRSYVAAVWIVQRSRSFLWQTTHLQSHVLATMFRKEATAPHKRRAAGSNGDNTAAADAAATSPCTQAHGPAPLPFRHTNTHAHAHNTHTLSLCLSHSLSLSHTHTHTHAHTHACRLYTHHVDRAKGRPISFHHLSKCGGTTMCQLAAGNRCSNPSMDEELNCVLNSSLDGPLWMVAHKVTKQGPVPWAALNETEAAAVLGEAAAAAAADASAAVAAAAGTAAGATPRPAFLGGLAAVRGRLAAAGRGGSSSWQFHMEPPLPMWLMYECPYVPRGRSYSCHSRARLAAASRATFLANERTLSQRHGVSELCPQFLNAITLRQPVPHVVSLLAEVRFRYVRQLAVKHGIFSWAPPRWNLTWWEAFGPALVGGYATRSLVGRESFCRSAAGMGAADLDAAVDALLGFDIVMTLGRPGDIDLLVLAMLGWPARSFSSQPASRVRTVQPRRPARRAAPGAAGSSESDPGDWLFGVGAGGPPPVVSPAADAGGRSSVPPQAAAAATLGSGRALLAASPLGDGGGGDARGGPAGSGEQRDDEEEDDEDEEEDSEPGGGEDNGGAFADPAESWEEPAVQPQLPPRRPAPPPMEASADALEAAEAVELVRASWMERELQRRSAAAPGGAAPEGAPPPPPPPVLPEGAVHHTGRMDEHGAHVVQVASGSAAGSDGELWHAFPRHTFAFAADDMRRLKALTAPDQQLVQTADLLLDLDAVWLRSLLHSRRYRERVRSAAATHTACGFSGMLPAQRDNAHEHVLGEQVAALAAAGAWAR